MNIDYTQAILRLLPNAGFQLTSNDLSTLNWESDPAERPSDAEIEQSLKDLQAEYDAKQYQRDRQYPPIGDQLDMLYHAIDAGKVDKTSDFYKALKAVKDKHPKG